MGIVVKGVNLSMTGRTNLNRWTGIQFFALGVLPWGKVMCRQRRNSPIAQFAAPFCRFVTVRVAQSFEPPALDQFRLKKTHRLAPAP